MPGEVSDDLVFLAMDRAGLGVGTALFLQLAACAIRLQRPILASLPARCIPGGVGIGSPGVPHFLAARTDVAVVLIIPCEVGSRERSVGPFTFVEDWDEGKDLAL